MNDFRKDGDTLIHEPKNTMQIDEVYCYVSVDPDGKEGIIAHSMEIAGSMMLMPLVFADKNTIEKMDPIIDIILKKTKKKIRILKMTNREVISEMVCPESA